MAMVIEMVDETLPEMKILCLKKFTLKQLSSISQIGSLREKLIKKCLTAEDELTMRLSDLPK